MGDRCPRIYRHRCNAMKKIQKTFAGKTAAQWLKHACICKSKACFPEIWLADGLIGDITPHEDLSIINYSGCVAVLKTSDAARKKLMQLVEQRKKIYL